MANETIKYLDYEGLVLYDKLMKATIDKDGEVIATALTDLDNRINNIQLTPGSPGLDGTDGKSAYEIAHDNGFQGSEQDWLASLVGPSGQNGTNGTNGKNLEFDWDGTSLGVRQQGESLYSYVNLKGDPGTNGTNGTNGSNGTTPHIDSTTGNWFIGDTNTGVQAQGPSGQNGTNGTNGTDGKSIKVVEKTSGTGAAGTTDTYTMYTDTAKTESVGTFSVYNGTDGTATLVMTAASANAPGASGLVPAPAAGDHNKFLRGDGTWGEKPSYAYGEIGYEVATSVAQTQTIEIDGTKPVQIITINLPSGTTTVTSVAFGQSNREYLLPNVGHICHVLFTSSTDVDVALSHVTTGSVVYICPNGESGTISVPAGGYAEVSFLRGADVNNVPQIYVRGI